MPNAIFVEWKERYSVGNNELDDQHKGIISIINDLYTAILHQTTQRELNSILDRLLEYTRSHFEREEQLMEKVLFPDLAKHRIAHDILARRTSELREQALHNKNDVAVEAMSFLKDWWIDHIIVMDSQYKPYMEGKEGLDKR